MSTNDADGGGNRPAQPRGALREYEKIKLDLADLIREVVAPDTGERFRFGRNTLVSIFFNPRTPEVYPKVS